MKAKDVQIGTVYVVKVSGKLTKVRLDAVSPYGGWRGTNLETKREVRIKTAAKLRRPVVPKVQSDSIPVADIDNGIDMKTGKCVQGCCEGDTSGTAATLAGDTNRRASGCYDDLTPGERGDNGCYDEVPDTVGGVPKAGATIDFVVQNEGSIFLLRPLTPAAKQWVSEHIPDDAQFFGDAVVVEHRYIQEIVNGIQTDGLVVS